MTQSRLMVALTAALIGVLAADGVTAQQPAPAASPSVAGAYTLAQVNDAQLPALIGEEGGCKREITAATLTLQPDNKWALEAKIRETCGDAVVEKTANQAGSFTANAAALEFKPAEPAAAPDAAAGANAAASTDASRANVQLPALTAATVNENTITVEHGDRKFIFKK
jgi:hypothetical protein